MDLHEPPSSFLKFLMAGEIPLSGNAFAETNLKHPLALTRDRDRANRDWAVFLLGQDEIDSSAVRDALAIAAEDDDLVVRAEAILGLARRDRDLALPFIKKALSAAEVVVPIFEAASIVADTSLVESLQPWIKPSNHDWFDQNVHDALSACENGFTGT
jgi:hypothetical protein